MLSSTFTDLKEHRTALIQAIKGQGLTDVAMENDSAKPEVDVIESSLEMVRDASAYIGVISRKYGQTPLCPKRNPRKLSITELEFNEAQKLKRPVLLFIMGEKHPLCEADFEINTAKRRKLHAFRQRAKQMNPDSPVHRVYATFDTLDDFTSKAIHAVANLRRYLNEESTRAVRSRTDDPNPTRAEPNPIPTPPYLYAEPSYIGSHRFVGREAQIDVLSDWSVAADPHPVLLFDAIGGSGKSMLTWEWTTHHAIKVRGDWAGRFWYSFYERGAIMSDFCGRALAYITGHPLEEFRLTKTPELAELLLHHLQTRPWLFILDGLERVLVAYHRFDAAKLLDEEANRPTDQIAQRDPCTAIRPEDDDLLRALAAAAPSKLVVTSRLVPRVLLNPASQPIPGVLRVSLPGLRPADAEALLRSCGITGSSQAIQNYLTGHCDCHPLVTGALAGLINDYLPDKGNFDSWVADMTGGGQLNLANLDLVQKRNHILKSALDALPEKSRQLLSTLALLSEAVDYPTLSALNPHLPAKPDEVKEPSNPEFSPRWKGFSDSKKAQAKLEYHTALQCRKEYEQTVKVRLRSPKFLAAPQALARTVRDLERRGLLQYDAQAKRHDLHPVVRGIAAGNLGPSEKNRYGQRVVDHFSHQAHSPYSEAETLEDFRDGLNVVRTLLHMGHHQLAYNAYYGAFATGLRSNLEAHVEVLSLVRPFFSHGWATLPDGIDERASVDLAAITAQSLFCIGEHEEALRVMAAVLPARVRQERWTRMSNDLSTVAVILGNQNRMAKDEHLRLLILDLATLIEDHDELIDARICRFWQLARMGQWKEAERIWQLLPPRDSNWPQGCYERGYVQAGYALFRFWKGDLTEKCLTIAERSAKAEKDRRTLRGLHVLRGEWQLAQGQWKLAADSLHEAVHMAREVALTHDDMGAEAHLALARFHLGQLSDPDHQAEQLATARYPSHHAVGSLFLAIGNHERAKQHGLAAYQRAWADGEPYVHRYELNKATILLKQLGADIPKLPPYDPTKEEKFTWEDEVTAAIENLRAEKEARSRNKN